MAIRKPIGIDANNNPAEISPADAVGVGHLAGTTGTPSVALAGLAGASASIVGNDLTGVITINLPVLAVLTTLTVTVTPANPYPSTPNVGFNNVGANPFNIISVGNISQSTASSSSAWVATLSIPISLAVATIKFNYQAMS